MRHVLKLILIGAFYFILTIYFTSCKSPHGSAELSDISPPIIPIIPPAAVDLECAPNTIVSSITNQVTAVNYNNVGLYIATENDYIWLKDFTSNYYFKVDSLYNIGGANVGLIYEDSLCAIPFGEVFNYPLHLSQDIYVFEFENQMYEYSTDTNFDFFGQIQGPYFFKTSGGSCHQCQGIVNNVRQIKQSDFLL